MSTAAQALPTQTFQVTASVVAGCVVTGASNGVWGTLNFGQWSAIDTRPVSASFVASSALQLACTPGTTLNMAINGGSHFTTTRNLKIASNSERVAYRLYREANHNASSEIGVNQSVGISYGDANHITLPIYGLLQLSGPTRAGVYSDTLTVTLSW